VQSPRSEHGGANTGRLEVLYSSACSFFFFSRPALEEFLFSLHLPSPKQRPGSHTTHSHNSDKQFRYTFRSDMQIIGRQTWVRFLHVIRKVRSTFFFFFSNKKFGRPRTWGCEETKDSEARTFAGQHQYPGGVDRIRGQISAKSAASSGVFSS
jgi:hypothetical protein